MREIKFRGKRLDNNEFIYGYYLCWFDEIEHHKIIDIVTLKAEEIDETTLSQFTGLHDKNGTEIYEGDIIAIDNREDVEFWFAGEIGIVEFIPARFTIVFEFDDKKMLQENFCDVIEIIGDIYP